MFRRFGKAFNDIIQKTHYRKLLFLYSAFTVLVVTISSFILISYFNHALSNEVDKYNYRTLSQIRTISDSILQEKVQSMVYTRFTDLHSNPIIRDFLSYNKGDDLRSIYAVYDTISNIVMSGNRLYNSIYIYRTSDDILISSREGIVYNFSENQIMQHYMNSEPIKAIMSSTEKTLWFSSLENSEFLTDKLEWNNISAITFAQSIPLISEKKYGSVIVNIDENIFLNNILSNFNVNSGDFFILDSKGEYFTGSNKSHLLLKDNYRELFDTIINQNEGSSTYKSGNSNHLVTWTNSSTSSWKYVLSVPIQIVNKQIYIARQFGLVVSFIILILALVSLHFITNRLYNPIRLLVKSVSEKSGTFADDVNELIFIDNVVTILSTEVRDMNLTIKKNSELIKHKIIADVITGNNLNNLEHTYERLNIVGIKMTSTYFILIFIEFDQIRFNELSSERREYLLYSMINIIDDYFNDGVSCTSISLKSNCIISLLNFNDSTFYKQLPEKLQFLTSILHKSLDIKCNISISTCSESILELPILYIQTEANLKYSFIYNYGNIFSPEMVKEHEYIEKYFDMSTIENIINLTRSFKIDALKIEISNVFLSLRAGKYTCQYVKNILIQILSNIYMVFKEQDACSLIPNYNKMFSGFSSLSSLDECEQWISELLESYMKSMGQRESKINYDYINNVAEYLTTHIDSQVSLNSVAEEFNISPNYLSKMFKMYIGISFSDFITDKKFVRAKEILLTDNTKNVCEIAETLGYYNIPYFISVFKKKYGLTPINYRKKYQHNNS